VPLPFLVSVPVVVAMTPLSSPLPLPIRFRLNVLPVTPPVKVSVPLPEASIVAPEPVSVMARLVLWPLPVYCNVPVPLRLIAGVPEPVPSALLLPELATVLTLSVPALMVTAPEKVFVPDSVRTPAPALVIAVPLMAPEIVKLEAFVMVAGVPDMVKGQDIVDVAVTAAMAVALAIVNVPGPEIVTPPSEVSCLHIPPPAGIAGSCGVPEGMVQL
jgi:hypothetical protein